MAVKKSDVTIDVMELNMGTITFRIRGTTPLIFNRMSQKGIQDLVLPPRKKNQAEKASTLKHNPLEEFRASPYMNRDPDRPALFHLPAGMFKGALSSAAKDIPGATKAQIGRLCSVTSTQIDAYGVPMIKADVVRMADINRTPDVRFRCVLPEWACEVTIRHVRNLVSANAIANLLAAAGVIIGVGDYRSEKGKGDFGQFALVDADDADWHRIVEEQGRSAQIQAMDNPSYYDEETREICQWFFEEVERRGNLPAPSTPRRPKANDEYALEAAE
jgi:hypothetical protein